MLDAGRGGWFQCYIVVHLKSMDKKFGMMKPEELEDAFVENKEEAREIKELGKFLVVIAQDTSNQLSKAGFKRMNSIIIAKDLSDQVNPITGGGVGGQANTKQHILTVDLDILRKHSQYAVQVLAHEWSHFVWFNVLDKASKEAFSNYWKQNIAIPIQKKSHEEFKQSSKSIKAYNEMVHSMALSVRANFFRQINKFSSQKLLQFYGLKDVKRFINARDFFLRYAKLVPKDSLKQLAWMSVKMQIMAESDKTEDWLKDAMVKRDNLINVALNSTFNSKSITLQAMDKVDCDYLSMQIKDSVTGAVYQFRSVVDFLNQIDILRGLGSEGRREAAYYESLLTNREKDNFPFTETAVKEATREALYWNGVGEKLKKDYSAFAKLFSESIKKYLSRSGSPSNVLSKTFESVIKKLYTFEDYVDEKISGPGRDFFKHLGRPQSINLRSMFNNGINTPTSDYASSMPEELWAVAVETIATQPNKISKPLSKMVVRLANGDGPSSIPSEPPPTPEESSWFIRTIKQAERANKLKQQ